MLNFLSVLVTKQLIRKEINRAKTLTSKFTLIEEKRPADFLLLRGVISVIFPF